MTKLSNKFCRLMVALLVMMSVSIVANAQSAADNLFLDGLKRQSVMTISSQNQAINRFNQARTAYDSAAKKQQCTTAIAVSNNIIKYIKSHPDASSNKNDTSKKPTEEAKEQIALEIDNDSIVIDNKGRTCVINVKTNAKEISVSPVETINDDNSFAIPRVEKDNSITIMCNDNTSTSTRFKRFAVIAGDQRKEFVVVQKGVPNILVINPAVVDFKAKGGSKNIEIQCNAEPLAGQTSLNWVVVSKPDWCDVAFDSKKTLDAMKKKSKSPASSTNIVSTKMITTYALVSVRKIEKGSPEAATGRTGEIVVRANETVVSIRVIQN